jgi:hypothetical protein
MYTLKNYQNFKLLIKTNFAESAEYKKDEKIKKDKLDTNKNQKTETYFSKIEELKSALPEKEVEKTFFEPLKKGMETATTLVKKLLENMESKGYSIMVETKRYWLGEELKATFEDLEKEEISQEEAYKNIIDKFNKAST